MISAGENIYVSTTKDGYFALERLLKRGKPIHQIITLPKSKSAGVSDYADFKSLSKKYGIGITFTVDINRLVVTLKKKKLNLVIVNGWSQILKKEILKLPLHGCVGTHPSLLPKNRGRAPIAWQIINGEKYGGVTLFHLDEGCDSGPIIDQVKFKIGLNENASIFYEKITRLGADMLLKNFDAICSGKAKSHKQNDLDATYLLKRRPNDSFIDFSANARQVHNLVRAESDVYPLAFFFLNKIKYLVLESKLNINYPKYHGTIGQIAKINDKEMWVLCVDGPVSFIRILDQYRNPVKIREIFKVGGVLNE